MAPSPIRVHADEVTYSLHVILRYRLERAMLDGDLPVTELPGACNDGMHSLLGVQPEGFADRCLQDIHWSMGLVGSFPTYSLGMLKAAQCFDTAKRCNPGLPEQLARGNLRPWLDWLEGNSHRHGSLLETDALLESATGKSLDAGICMQHLVMRYGKDAPGLQNG